MNAESWYWSDGPPTGDRLAEAIFTRSDPDPRTRWHSVREELSDMCSEALSAARDAALADAEQACRKLYEDDTWKGAYRFGAEDCAAAIAALRKEKP